MRNLILSALAFLLVADAQATSLLTRSGRWFVDSAGNGINLSGFHNWVNLQDVTGVSDAGGINFSYTSYLNTLQSLGHNHIRMWQLEGSQWTPSSSSQVISPLPWKRTGPGNAADGHGLKFDLTQFDQNYFDRLSNEVQQADARGIYVTIMMYDGTWFNGDQAYWPTIPHNDVNNINGFGMTTNTLYTTSNSGWYNAQTNYVKKLVDTVNGFNNVLYEIINEGPIQSTNFQFQIINQIKNYEATLPKQHPVVMSSLDQAAGATTGNNWLAASPADAIAPNGGGANFTTYTNAPPVSSGSYVSWLDTDHVYGDTGPSRLAMSWFCRGYSVLSMDSMGISGFSAANTALRTGIQQMMRYANKTRIATLVPSTSVSSTGFCLTNSDPVYLAYSTGHSSFTVSMVAGNYAYEFFDPVAGTVSSAGQFKATSGSNTITPPASHTVDTIFWAAPYKVGGGLDFDGVDDVVSVGTPAVLNDVGTITIAAWIFPRSLDPNNFGRIVTKEVSSTGGWLFCTGGFVGHTPALEFFRYFGTTAGDWLGPTGSIIFNTWQHVAMTYNRGSTANNPVLYVNGQSVTVTTHSTPAGTLTSDATGTFRIGNSPFSSDGFDGLIQNVRVYNRILTAAEITQLYNGGRFYSGITSGLIGWWPLTDVGDGASAGGATMVDRSTSKNNGTASRGANTTGLTGRAPNLIGIK